MTPWATVMEWTVPAPTASLLRWAILYHRKRPAWPHALAKILSLVQDEMVLFLQRLLLQIIGPNFGQWRRNPSWFGFGSCVGFA